MVHPILFMPWINANNYEVYESFRNCKSDILMGHLEISGFEMHQGSMVQKMDMIKNTFVDLILYSVALSSQVR